MSFLNRAAISAVIVATFGLASISAPGLANDLDHAAITTPITQPVIAAPSDSTNSVNTDATTQTDDESVDYASLADAVSAQDMPASLDGELKCLAIAVYYEAKGEPLSGQLAVAKVILNRTHSGRFPKSVCAVVEQAGQFSFVRRGVMPEAPVSAAAFRTATAIAQVAMNDDWDSSVGSALYFHARRVAPGWRMTKVAAIGNHVFYR